MTDSRLYNRRDTSRELKVSVRTVDVLVKEGALESIMIGRRRLFPGDAIDAYIEKRRAEKGSEE